MRDGRAALLCIVLAGCSYDWSPGRGVASGDAAADAPHEGAASTDAATGSDGGGVDAAGNDAIIDVIAEPPSCAELQSQVQQTLGAALACVPTAQPCTTVVEDACLCQVVVGAANQATTNYENAVSAWKGSGCPLGCTSCGAAPQQGLCIVSDAGAATYACAQF
jgi:hypothetical protein